MRKPKERGCLSILFKVSTHPPLSRACVMRVNGTPSDFSRVGLSSSSLWRRKEAHSRNSSGARPSAARSNRSFIPGATQYHVLGAP